MLSPRLQWRKASASGKGRRKRNEGLGAPKAAYSTADPLPRHPRIDRRTVHSPVFVNASKLDKSGSLIVEAFSPVNAHRQYPKRKVMPMVTNLGL